MTRFGDRAFRLLTASAGALPTLIYEQFGIAAGNTDSPPFQRAWGAALVLIVLVGLLNLLARFIARYAKVRK
jgi:phosphate transport system permease protein